MNKNIYVRLLNEGTDVRRPTLARALGNGLFEILACEGYDPADEAWEFPPGTPVRVQRIKAADGDYFLAVKA